MSDELREAAQVILDRCLDFFGGDDLDPESSEAMPVVIKNRWVYDLRAALAARPDSPTLDVEWAKAEAMVPEGWKLRLVWHRDADDPTQRYEARLEKSAHDWTGDEKPRRGWAHSPSAALAALAALAPAAAPAAREDPRPAGPWTGDPADYNGDEGR